jgi:hypothetical protein
VISRTQECRGVSCDSATSRPVSWSRQLFRSSGDVEKLLVSRLASAVPIAGNIVFLVL